MAGELLMLAEGMYRFLIGIPNRHKSGAGKGADLKKEKEAKKELLKAYENASKAINKEKVDEPDAKNKKENNKAIAQFIDKEVSATRKLLNSKKTSVAPSPAPDLKMNTLNYHNNALLDPDIHQKIDTEITNGSVRSLAYAYMAVATAQAMVKELQKQDPRPDARIAHIQEQIVNMKDRIDAFKDELADDNNFQSIDKMNNILIAGSNSLADNANKLIGSLTTDPDISASSANDDEDDESIPDSPTPPIIPQSMSTAAHASTMQKQTSQQLQQNAGVGPALQIGDPGAVFQPQPASIPLTPTTVQERNIRGEYIVPAGYYANIFNKFKNSYQPIMENAFSQFHAHILASIDQNTGIIGAIYTDAQPTTQDDINFIATAELQAAIAEFGTNPPLKIDGNNIPLLKRTFELAMLNNIPFEHPQSSEGQQALQEAVQGLQTHYEIQAQGKAAAVIKGKYNNAQGVPNATINVVTIVNDQHIAPKKMAGYIVQYNEDLQKNDAPSGALPNNVFAPDSEVSPWVPDQQQAHDQMENNNIDITEVEDDEDDTSHDQISISSSNANEAIPADPNQPAELLIDFSDSNSAPFAPVSADAVSQLGTTSSDQKVANFIQTSGSDPSENPLPIVEAQNSNANANNNSNSDISNNPPSTPDADPYKSSSIIQDPVPDTGTAPKGKKPGFLNRVLSTFGGNNSKQEAVKEEMAQKLMKSDNKIEASKTNSNKND